jgi:hypothetical protein
MGKGNRSRQDRAFETVQNIQEETPKNTKLITTIATIAVSLLLVGCLLLSVVVNTGIVLRTQTAAKTDNFSVSGTVMSYLIYSQAQQMVALYQQYGINYTLADVLNSSFDSMATSTLDQVKQMLVLCEYAKANGIELSAEDEKAIDDYMASIDEAAANNLYSTNSYIKLMYGNGVNASDIRKSLELNYLSNAAYKAIEAKLETEITEEAMNKYIEENVDLFYMADYLTYTYTAELTPAGAEATVEETQAYEAEKATMAALAEKLAAVKSADEFKSTAADHIVNTTCSEKFDELYEKEALTDAPAADILAADKANVLALVLKSLTSEEEVKFEKSADNAYNNALSEIFDELCDEAQTAYDAIVKEDSLHYDPETEADKITELDKWLFDEATKVGDTKTVPSEGDKKSTYSVYFMENTSHLDESETKDVAHILVQFESSKPTDEQKAAAKAEAEQILADYLAGEKTQEAFEKLGEEKTDDSNVVYEGVAKGQMVEAFENWIFDEARTAGETGIVETEYGYHVMFFIGDGKLAWENTAHSGVLSDLFTDWVEANAETYHYTAKESVVNSIK